jgi:hypothetical protein
VTTTPAKGRRVAGTSSLPAQSAATPADLALARSSRRLVGVAVVRRRSAPLPGATGGRSRGALVVEAFTAAEVVVVAALLFERRLGRAGVAEGEAGVAAVQVHLHTSQRRSAEREGPAVASSARRLGGRAIGLVAARCADPVVQGLPHVGVGAADVEDHEHVPHVPKRVVACRSAGHLVVDRRVAQRIGSLHLQRSHRIPPRARAPECV